MSKEIIKLNDEEIKELTHLCDAIKYLNNNKKTKKLAIPKTVDKAKTFMEEVINIINKSFKKTPNELYVGIILDSIELAQKYDAITEEEYKEAKDFYKSIMLIQFKNNLKTLKNIKGTKLPKNDGELVDYLIDVDKEITRCVNNKIITNKEAQIFYKRLDNLYNILDVSFVDNTQEEELAPLSLDDIRDEFNYNLEKLATLDITVKDLKSTLDYYIQANRSLKDFKIRKIISKIKNVISSIDLTQEITKDNCEDLTLNYIYKEYNQTHNFLVTSIAIEDLRKAINSYAEKYNLFNYETSLNEETQTDEKEQVKDPVLEKSLTNLIISLISSKFLVKYIPDAIEVLNESSKWYDSKTNYSLKKIADLLYELKINPSEYDNYDGLTLEEVNEKNENNKNLVTTSYIHEIINDNLNKQFCVDKYKKYMKQKQNKLNKQVQLEGKNIYKFYKLCKKYGTANKNKITGRQVYNWFNKNEKIKKALLGLKNPSEDMKIDIEYAEQTARYISNKLNNVIEYNEYGEITNNSYLEYLKQREIKESHLAETKLGNSILAAKDYSEALELNASNRLNKYQNYYNQANKKTGIRIGLGLLATVVVFTSGIGLFSNKKRQDNNADKVEEVLENNDYCKGIDFNIQTNGLNEIIAKAKETIYMAEMAIKDLPVEQTSVIFSLQDKINNLIKSIASKSSDIMENMTILNEELANINNQKVESEVTEEVVENLVTFNSDITFKDNVIYSNMYDLTNEANAKTTYYDCEDSINRKVDAIVFYNDTDIVLAHNEEEANKLIQEGYNVSGYRITNMYSNDNQTLTYEGYAPEENVLVRNLEK